MDPGCAHRILSFLTTRELVQMRMSCKLWSMYSQDASLWRAACARDWLLDEVTCGLAPGASDSAASGTTAGPPTTAQCVGTTDAERVWREQWREFGRYARAGVYRRVASLWRRLKAWLAVHLEEALPTLVP